MLSGVDHGDFGRWFRCAVSNAGGEVVSGQAHLRGRVIHVNATISGNVASDQGGGPFSSGTNPVLTNCILRGNTAPVRSEIGLVGGLGVADSCIEGGPSGAGCSGDPCTDLGGNIGDGSGDDPLFVREPYAGADGSWDGVDDDYGDLRLSAGSPCIDAGLNAAVPAGVSTDLDGAPRVVDGDGNSSLVVDMGAYEHPKGP